MEEPIDYIPGILKRVKKEYLQKIYKVDSWVDHEDFVAQIALNYGKLKKVKILLINYRVVKLILKQWPKFF